MTDFDFYILFWLKKCLFWNYGRLPMIIKRLFYNWESSYCCFDGGDPAETNRKDSHPPTTRSQLNWNRYGSSSSSSSADGNETSVIFRSSNAGSTTEREICYFLKCRCDKNSTSSSSILAVEARLNFEYLSVLLTSLSTTKSYVRQLLIRTFLFFCVPNF